MSYFTARRNVELSTLDYLTTQLQNNWSGITVVKSFTQAYDTGINPPIVAIRLEDVTNDRLEIGSNNLINTYSIAIDIFARSDGQRIDLAEFIIEQLKSGWIYYTFGHASGNPETLEKTQVGRVFVFSYDTDTPVRFAETVDVKDRFRHSIIVTTMTGLV